MPAGQDLASKNGSLGDEGQLPEPFSAAFRNAALAGESPVAWLETDLNAELRFARGLVLLTDRRLLSFPPDTNGNRASSNVAEWTVAPTLSVLAHEHAGLGALELFEGETRLARWRYTAVQAPAANRLVRRFDTLVRPATAAADEVRTWVCPSCGAVLDVDLPECPHCKPEVGEPSRFVLLRLVRFAWPWMWVIGVAFALTLAANGASVIPMYLTKPL